MKRILLIISTLIIQASNADTHTTFMHNNEAGQRAAYVTGETFESGYLLYTKIVGSLLPH